ncbi:MAG: ROK family protein [Leptolinea sp.]|jgi:glucokinase|nr:ROK family protein [Leptolinea sp.]
MKYIAGIDLGGTNIKTVIVNTDFKVVVSKSVPTPFQRPKEETFSVINHHVENLLQEGSIERKDLLGIGFGIPGLTDSRTNVAYNIPFLGWTNTNMAEPIRQYFGVPVFAENDGNVNALGEMHFGAGRGFEDILLITLGTGLGCGIITGGKLLHGASRVAAEAGHMVIEAGGDQCVCGKRGCFESCCSGTALTRYARRFAIEFSETSLMKETNGNLFAITGEMIQRGYDDGDLVCRKVIEVFSEKLSVGLVNLIDLFNPGIVIISGGVARLGDRVLTPTRRLVEASLMHPVQKCDIVQGQLDSNAGVMGACSLVAEGLNIPIK